MRRLIRLELRGEAPRVRAPDGVRIRPYHRPTDHALIPEVYARAFGEPAWTGEWERFQGFDPRGVFVAESVADGRLLGFVISYHRDQGGYVSVLAVEPAWRRRGVGGRLVRRAIDYQRASGQTVIRADVQEDNSRAIEFYIRLGFRPVEARNG